MPSSTMREESEYRLPAHTPFPAMLEAVEEKEIPYTDRVTGEKRTFTKWEWVFQIVEGEYAGLSAYGDTEGKLTTHPDNLVRQWAEVLRDAPFGIGEGLNTDDLLGLPCVISVRHDPPRPKKDGGKFYPCPVDQVFPEGTNPQFTSENESDEIPF
jgi:hypothetical protein